MKKANSILLALLISFAAILNYVPHMGYPYPFHVDEWVHYQYAAHLSQASPLYFGGDFKINLESGFHNLLATLNSLCIDYLFLFNFFPVIITIFICLGVFVLARKIYNETTGIFSVVFMVILKSSVMILGPVFLIPLTVGLFLILAGLYTVYIESKVWVIMLACLLIMHPPSALAFLLLINIEFLLLYHNNKKKYFINIFWEIISVIIAFPLYLPILLNKGIVAIESLRFTPITGLVFIPGYLGWMVVFFVLLGVYFSVLEKKFSFIIYSIALLFFIIIFYNFKIEIFIPYARALMYLFMIFSILFGLGCEKVINIFKNNKLKIIAYFIIIAILLCIGINSKIHSNDYFYNIINKQNYDDFIFIKNNTDANSVVLVDPWIANALTPIAERMVFSRVMQEPNEIYEKRNREIRLFFNSSCNDTQFLKNNDISVVYNSLALCNNNNLKEIRKGVYVLK